MIDPADRVFSIWIRLRDMRCLRCNLKVILNDRGLPVSHENSHFKSRDREATRFDEDNCCTLCSDCHAYFTKNPDEHYAWQVERLGQEEVDRIILKSNSYKKKDRKSEYRIWATKLRESGVSV